MLQLETCQTYHFKVTGPNMLKMSKRVTQVGVYGAHTQVKRLFKALMFSHVNKT